MPANILCIRRRRSSHCCPAANVAQTGSRINVSGRTTNCDASSNFGARFQALHACSPECARTVRRGPGRIVVTLRCQWCGEAFTANRRDARYCSAAHRKAAHHQARNPT